MTHAAALPLIDTRPSGASHPHGLQPGSLRAETGTVAVSDTSLFYRAWLPPGQVARAVVLFHGGHEHSGRFGEVVERLARALPGTAFFAWDARGHGRSPGERGDAPHFMTLVRDADAFVREMSVRHAIAIDDMAVLGHSVGSVVAATWISDHAPPLRAAVLGSPAFDVRLYVPFALAGLRLLERVSPNAHVNSYVRPGMLTHDAAEAASRRADPLISPRISVRVLTSLYDTAARVIDGAPAITVPTLVLSAGRDWVVNRGAQARFFARLGASRKRMRVLPGFHHEVFHERDRAVAIDAAAAFFRDAFDAGRPCVAIPRSGLGHARHAALRRPLPIWSPRGLGFRATRLLMRTVGRLSRGIRIGWEAGFDSGRSLEHVYENRAAGFGSLGRAIDRAYLDSAGWRGIRERGRHLGAALDRAIERRPGRPVHVLDVAGGPGRYLVDCLARHASGEVTAECRDLDEAGLEEGRALARARGVETIVYRRGDACDAASFTDLDPRPDIVVVSGLYELIEDNEIVRASLAAVHGALADDGTLLVTNQPRHPQLELIARVLDNRDGDRWVMRPRSQAELAALLADSGFALETTRMDDGGVFSVNAARKVRAP